MYQEFNASEANSVGARASGAESMAELLVRYPGLSDFERARMVKLYRKMTPLEVALLISDDELGRKLERFFSDHRTEVRTPFREYAMLVAIAISGVLITLWAIVT